MDVESKSQKENVNVDLHVLFVVFRSNFWPYKEINLMINQSESNIQSIVLKKLEKESRFWRVLWVGPDQIKIQH